MGGPPPRDDQPGPAPAASTLRSRPVRWLYLLAGCAFVGLGAIGAVLPIVPTTPFMLLALWAFSRSSARLEHWLLHHRRFGPSVRRWREHRVVPLKVKLVAWTSMAVSLFAMAALSPAPWWTVALTAALMAYAVWFVARCPSRPPPSAPSAPPPP